jgi:hypothetical protein
MWAEAIPDLAAVIGLFFLVVGYCVARGLLASWQNSIGYLLQWMAANLRIRIPTGFSHVTIDLGGPFRSADAWVVASLQTYCEGAEIAISRLFHGLQALVVGQAEAFEWVARETSQAFDWLLNLHLPKITRQFVTGAALGALIARAVSAAVAHLRPEITKTVRVVDHTITRTVPAVAAAIGAGAIALPGWVIHLPRSIHNVVEQLGRVEHRLRKVELAVGATAFAATIANAWGIPLRCARSGGPIARLARSMCGLPGHFLNDVLGLLADFFVLENICTVLPWVEDAGSKIGEPLIATLTEVGAGLCDAKHGPPGRMTVPALYLAQPTNQLLAGV